MQFRYLYVTITLRSAGQGRGVVGSVAEQRCQPAETGNAELPLEQFALVVG
jgi:hypothetical protein